MKKDKNTGFYELFSDLIAKGQITLVGYWDYQDIDLTDINNKQ